MAAASLVLCEAWVQHATEPMHPPMTSSPCIMGHVSHFVLAEPLVPSSSHLPPPRFARPIRGESPCGPVPEADGDGPSPPCGCR